MNDPVWRHPKSIATQILSGSLPEKLEAAAQAGFDAVELFEDDLLRFSGTPSRAGQLAAELGLRIALYQPLRDVEAMPGAYRRTGLQRARRCLDVMDALGAGLLLVCSNVQPQTLDDPARAADDLREIADMAQERGIKVGYEALSWGHHVKHWQQAWDIVRRADHKALGLILDSFHTLSLGGTLDGLNKTVPAEKLFFVQLADAPRMSLDVCAWSRHHRDFPGRGDLPVVDFASAAINAGYRGPLSLELFNDRLRAAPASQTARDGMHSLRWLESQTDAAARRAHRGIGAPLR